MTEASQLARAARWYAEHGFAVFPCKTQDKVPATQHGCRDATTDVQQVEAWWGQVPDANVGVATGSTIFVVDIDGPEGEASWKSLVNEHGPVPPTLEQTTGRGRHLWFCHPKDETIRNSAAKLGSGLDVRGAGGYVVAAPSIHPDGRAYQWKDGHKPGQIDLAEPPRWLLDLVIDKPPPEPEARPQWKGNGADVGAYAQAAFDGEAADVANAPAGQRNDTLNRAAHNLGGLVATELLDHESVVAELTRAALHAGLDRREIEKTIASGLTAGMAKPREVPDPAQPLTVRRHTSLAATAPSWCAPSALPPLAPHAPELPCDLLPQPLQPWLVDAAERIQIPLEFLAAPAIVGLSSLVGRRIGIFPKRRDDWFVVPNLWGAVIARPGFMKTPAMNEALGPLRKLAAKATSEFGETQAFAEADEMILKARLSALQDEAKSAVKKNETAEVDRVRSAIADVKRKLADSEVSERRYIVNDPTIEKLGELLNQNPRGLLLSRDELSGFLRLLDKPGREGDREFYLETWNGDGGYSYDRIGRGTLHIPALTLSIIGTIQPGKLVSYVSGAIQGERADDGLLQRFQVAVWPEASGEWRNVDRAPDGTARGEAYDIYRRLDELDPLSLGIEAHRNDIPAFRFAPEAQELFDEWRTDLERRLREPEMASCPAFESHLAKYRSLMPSLALIFHLAEIVTSVSFVSAPAVGLESAKRAAAWCEFLEAHARKIYAAEMNAGMSAAHALADKIRAGAVEDVGSVRDLYRPQWSGLKTPEAVWSGLMELQKFGWLRVEERETGGRTTDVVVFNPEIRERAS